MKIRRDTSVRQLGLPEMLIVTGSCVFVFVLWLSAYLEPEIRSLHFLQSWMYIVAVYLSVRGNRWGYFIGISAAAFWNYISLFVNNFFSSGAHWLLTSISTGELKHLDQIVAVPAWIGNFALMLGGIWAYSKLRAKGPADVIRLLLAFSLTTGFFASAIAFCQPRYLPLFSRALHPHWLW